MTQSYTPITREEFEEVLDKTTEYEVATDSHGKEVAYDIDLPHPELTVRIFSTLVAGQARGCGEDAIRCVIWHEGKDVPVSGREKTLRIGPTPSNPQGWKGNLVPKIADLMYNWQERYYGDCPDCGGVLQLKEGQYGEFLGCSNYPDCEHTEQT